MTAGAITELVDQKFKIGYNTCIVNNKELACTVIKLAAILLHIVDP
jgi:hypothetical protein